MIDIRLEKHERIFVDQISKCTHHVNYISTYNRKGLIKHRDKFAFINVVILEHLKRGKIFTYSVYQHVPYGTAIEGSYFLLSRKGTFTRRA